MTNTNNKEHSTKYQLICGMEVHAELKTASKMFCGCKNDPFHAPGPNTYTCPVCLGMPGGLPVANKIAVEWTIKLGLALNCKINLFSKFDRKHYFYPDLPKGYQISQYDLPFCYDGYLETSFGKVRIRRIHLEEDTAKLIHGEVNGQKASLIDFNRSSVPLVEVVTEADVSSPKMAKEYSKKLREIMRYLDIADCDMEQGGMRLEANVSLLETSNFKNQSSKGQVNRLELKEDQLPKYKVELKNINSFRFLEAAVNYEIDRQVSLLDQGETPAQETRGYDSVRGETFSQRSKESAEDYRYFPDPDLPPLHFTKAQIASWQKDLPELPDAIRARFISEYDLPIKVTEQLTTTQKEVKWIEEVFVVAQRLNIQPATIAQAIINKKITTTVEMEPLQVVEAYKQSTATESVDTDQLETVIRKVASENPDAVEKLKSGQQQLIGFFMGQIMRSLGKKIDPLQVKTELLKIITQL